MKRDKEELLFETLSNAAENVYIFVNDMETDYSMWSDNAVTYFALPQDYHTRILEIWLELIHPEDRQGYISEITQVMEGKKPKHSAQYRAKNRYGDYVWVECTGHVTRDENGVPKLFAGIITRLDNQSKYDPLTKKLSIHEFYLSNNLTEPMTALLFGMDKFRRVLHSYGYEAGNEIMVAMAEALDRPNLNQLVYRMNGDEFLVIMPAGSEAKAKAYFNEVLGEVHRFCRENSYITTIAFSCAGASYTPGQTDKFTLMKQLEHTMEQAKAFGGGQLIFFSKEIEAKHRRVHDIAVALEEAIANNYEGFELYYQPVMRACDNRLSAVEALLRFHTEELGWISPVEFIPILENNRSILEVGLWVMEQVIKQNRLWNDKYSGINTGFNVSYLQLHNDELIDKMLQLVKRYGVEPNLITVELTESCKVEHPESLSIMFNRLIENGFRVALDDFGMENSTLTLLRDTPVTTVKIDHSFVRTIAGNDSKQDKANMAIIVGIITMCKKLGHRVVIEGVETSVLAEKMKEAGADFLQGYYYSRPVAAKEIEGLFSPKNEFNKA